MYHATALIKTQCLALFFYKKVTNKVVATNLNTIKTYKNKSGDAILNFDGLEIEKVIINKPKLKKSKSPKYEKV